MNLLVKTKNIKFERGSELILNNINISLLKGERVGLVGPNGSGKTTFMKIMAGIILPTSGEIQNNGRSYYVPQLNTSLLQSNKTVLEYIIEFHESWWEVTETMNRFFESDEVDINRYIKTLSGGELVKLHLAIGVVKDPDIFLLDEPTNHLDLHSISILTKFLNNYSGTFVVVSHDPFFLDNVVNTIWETEDKTINKYGGDYSDYLNQKKLKQDSKERQYDVAKKELGKVKKAILIENKRAARSIKTGREMKYDRGISASERGFFKNKASTVAGVNKIKLESSKELKEKKLGTLVSKNRKKVYLELETNVDSKKKSLIKGEKLNLTIEDGTCLIQDSIFSISYGERILITGNNGSGKTALVKSLLGNSNEYKLAGELYFAKNIKTVYLSQNYEIIDPNLSLIDNMINFNPGISYEEVRRQLGNFLFYNENDIKKIASTLSGGETARLAFAMSSLNPIDLFILDEPTNNLDIETIETITNSLNLFKGALIVISHNLGFISNIGITKAIILNKKVLTTINNPPINKDEFYKELLTRFN